MTKVKHSCYKQRQKGLIILKSYGVFLSPENKLCNSVMVLTEVFRTVNSDSQV
ncbi:hypothetical protein [Vagococcus sp. WN89Y]|uniref:hypothetical protein n=1 Tax=Vagococcus sp. WN89Y TaxID=3457258 RepID=UPI003FCEBB19